MVTKVWQRTSAVPGLLPMSYTGCVTIKRYYVYIFNPIQNIGRTTQIK